MPKASKLTAKTPISDAQLHNWLIAMFEKGNTGKTNLYELLRTSKSIMKERCLKAYDKAIVEWQEMKEKSTSEQVEANTIEQLKTGLKSKIEKKRHIQDQINGIQADLDRAIVEDYVVLGGKLQVVNKIMNAETKAYLRKTMKDLYAELNKMDGDYAPVKSKQEITIDKPVIIDWNGTA